MLKSIGTTELLIILAIILLLFGAGRISKLGSEFGGAIGAFRKEARKSAEDEKEG